MVENERTEYKEKLTAALEKEAVAFLNAHGGTIYIGIDKNGNPVGVDKCDALQLEIKDRLITGIRPSVMGLFVRGRQRYADFVRQVCRNGSGRFDGK